MISLQEIVNSKSKTFLAFCFCFLAGILFASFVNRKFDFIFLYFFFIFLSGFLIIFWRDQKPRFIFIGLLLFLLAFVRYNLALPDSSKNNISFYNDSDFSFEVVIDAEPDVRIDGVGYIVKPDNFSDKVYLKSKLYPRYEYGDRLRLECTLKTPVPIEDFRYDMYLARLGVFSICVNPQIEKIGSGEGNFVLKNILQFKQVFAERINKLWHEPYAGFMAGLLYGYRGGLGDLQTDFNRTGVTHIVAISGYNISVIAIILITFCVHLWIPRKYAFWLVVFGIFLFVIFTGASGSVVRAGLMGCLVLLAQQLGRLNRINNAMALTAVLMTVYNPFVLVWDAGFQLSFLATIGLVYLSPILKNKFKKIPDLFGIKESLISTLSAIIITFPLILYQFGRLSTVAPIVNILILWLIPFVMIFGFLSVFFSFIFYPLGQILSWFTFLMLKYITTVVGFFAGLPFASVELFIPIWVCLLVYLFIFIRIMRNYVHV